MERILYEKQEVSRRDVNGRLIRNTCYSGEVALVQYAWGLNRSGRGSVTTLLVGIRGCATV